MLSLILCKKHAIIKQKKPKQFVSVFLFSGERGSTVYFINLSKYWTFQFLIRTCVLKSVLQNFCKKYCVNVL